MRAARPGWFPRASSSSWAALVSPAASPQPTNEPLLVVMNVNAFFVIPARWGLVK